MALSISGTGSIWETWEGVLSDIQVGLTISGIGTGQIGGFAGADVGSYAVLVQP